MADITRVQVLQNHLENVGANGYITLHPGLKITVRPRLYEYDMTIIVVAMPDAVEFGAKLSQLTSTLYSR